MSYCSGQFPRDHIPTSINIYIIVFNGFNPIINIKNEKFQLNIIDTAGQDDFDGVRDLCYNGTCVFLLAFSIDNMNSLEMVRDRWYKDISLYQKNAIRILVGTKNDLREDNDNVISKDFAINISKQLKCSFYHECSALTQDGLNDLFQNSLVEYINHSKSKKEMIIPRIKDINCCQIL